MPDFTEADLYARIEKRMKADQGWVVFAQVANATGWSASRRTRWADAVAMNLWPSKGFELQGFEIKRTVHDFRRELSNQAKVEEGAYEYMHRWWIVAPRGVVPLDELPVQWGLLETHGQALRATVKAPKLEPKEAGLPFICAMLRRAHEAMEVQQRPRLVAEFRRGMSAGKKGSEEEAATWKATHETLLRHVKEFQEASGMTITGWNHPAELGALVQQFVRRPPEHIQTALERLAKEAQRVADEAKAGAATLAACLEAAVAAAAEQPDLEAPEAVEAGLAASALGRGDGGQAN